MRWGLQPQSSFHSPMLCGVSLHAALPIWGINRKAIVSRSRGNASRQEPLRASHLAGHTCCPGWELGFFSHGKCTWGFFQWKVQKSRIDLRDRHQQHKVPWPWPQGLPLWVPPGPKPAQGAGNVTTGMTRQDIHQLGRWTQSHQEVILFNTAKHLQRTSEGSYPGIANHGGACTVGAFYGRMVLGLATGNSCSSILPALRMLQTATLTYWP